MPNNQLSVFNDQLSMLGNDVSIEGEWEIKFKVIKAWLVNAGMS